MKIKQIPLFLTTCALVTGTAPAAIFIADTLTSPDGNVSIAEIENGTVGDSIVKYAVDVAPGTQLASFVVSSKGTRLAGPFSQSTGTPRGWNVFTLGAAGWDSGQLFGLRDNPSLTTTDLGSFASLFGDDDYVTAFLSPYNTDYDPYSDPDWNPFDPPSLPDPFLTDGNDVDQSNWSGLLSDVTFFRTPFSRFGSGPASSEFLALNQDGSIISQSSTVPEPSSLALLALGSAGLITRRRRKA